MREVGGKPILQHIIERANRDGFHNFIISLHYLGEMIEDYFGDGAKFGVNIQYLREQNPLGTAGCLSLIKEIPRLPFVVTNGDVLTDINYNELLNFHIRHSADATMAVRQHEIQNQFGVVKTSGIEIDGFEEKPIYRSHVNAGIYVLNPESLNYLIHEQHCDMPTLFQLLKENFMKTVAYPMHEPWLDVGRPEDLQLARKMQS
jgi:NDP-sugar pyrophosphorylase family protein